MANFCIPKSLIGKLKEAAKAGEINIAKMYEMDSAGRRSLFEKYVPTEMAHQINGEFEGAMISKQKDALRDWAGRTFNAKQKKTAQYQGVLMRIDQLDTLGVLDSKSADSFLQDLVATRLGITIGAEEARTISEKADTLKKLAEDRTEFGTPTVEYFTARKDMENYIDSLTPTAKLRVLTETIGRGTLLASIKSPFLNIESNTIQGLLQAFKRRVETRRVGMGINNDAAVRYIKLTNEIYAKSGYDISRMLSVGGERQVRGEAKPGAQGEGRVRAVGRFYEDIVFKRTQGAPDVFFSSMAFADRVNLESTKIAKGEGLSGAGAKARALEIFKDATSIEPKTEEAAEVRARAIADAQFSTYTNKSTASTIALGIRSLFNLASGDLRVGDQLMPFVKTPANVIAAGLDNSGVLLAPDAAIRISKTVKSIHAGESVKVALGENFTGFADRVIRAGFGMTFAFILASLFKPDDFIGEYPVSEKERQLLALRNATTNSVKIGGKWISLDYFGALGAPMVGFLYAKKYGKNLPEMVWEFHKGVFRQIAKLPGFEEARDIVEFLEQRGKGDALVDEVRDVANYLIGFIRARTIPSIVSDFARGTDVYERKTVKEDLLSPVKAGIPGFRQTLPIKKTVFGEEMKAEPLVSVLMFGQRIKTVRDDKVITELIRLAEVGQLPSITDVEKTSPRAGELKDQVGDKRFDELKTEFGKRLRSAIARKMESVSYISANDEDKKEIIDRIKSEEFEDMLHRGGYRKPKK